MDKVFLCFIVLIVTQISEHKLSLAQNRNIYETKIFEIVDMENC